MTTTKPAHLTTEADKEKQKVALSSVGAAILLTTIKIIVGVITGSLGILSEAAHSALDLVAAAVTYFAVRISGKPPDSRYTYGYGKVENLSALFETFLLLITCIWIIYEALSRLFFKEVEVEVSPWAFVIMIVSIAVDVTRSRALLKAAKKYNSQALEADALHFSTDVWSSSVVIGGLVLVSLSEWLNLPWLAKADALAALGVAGIVIYVSIQLGRKTIDDLLDAVPPGLRDAVAGAALVPGVQAVRKVRLRRAGPEIFADITVDIGRDTPLERAEEIAALVQGAVLKVLPGSDVVVEISSVVTDNESTLTTIRMLAARHSLGAHGIRLYNVAGQQSIELHLEVSDTLTLAEAHRQASDFEAALLKEITHIQKVTTHLEPVGEATAVRHGAPLDEQRMLDVLRQVSAEMGIDLAPHDLSVHHVGDESSISFHCVLPADIPVTDAHNLTERVETALRARLSGLGRVVIHVETPEQPESPDQPPS